MKVFSFLILAIVTLNAWGDDMRPASLTISARDATTLDVTWKMPIKNGQRQPLQVVMDEKNSSPKRSHVINNAYVEYWSVKRQQGINGLKVVIDGLKGAKGDVLVRIIDTNQQTITTVLNTEKPEYQVPQTIQLSKLDTVSTYLILGIEHILVGLDHLFFVACLIYIAGTFRKILLTITGFTLAHSITLILAALEVVQVPLPPVEAVIALSIVFLASEIAKNRRDKISFRYPILVSSSFGLLHGFGFASVLAEIGLPQNEKVLALLCFNLGVEVGQILFVIGLFFVYALMTKLLKFITMESLRVPVSYFSGIIATVWMVERLAAF